MSLNNGFYESVINKLIDEENKKGCSIIIQFKNVDIIRFNTS